MLDVKHIRKVYTDGQKSVDVLKGIDVRIDAGQFIAITGPSGAGKSTLLHIMGGLDVPTEGVITFKGEDIYRLSDTALSRVRNKGIGFVFQFYHLLSEFTVLENVTMPARIGPEPEAGNRELTKRALGLLKEVGLGERIEHFPSQLSGGEQQRVAIARALVNAPELLLCDEPTGNLDSETGSGIMALLRTLNKKSRMAVVLVTHNIDIAKSADKVYNLKDGRLLS
jgi:lipoprotein-releasing system ATP-binding protein